MQKIQRQDILEKSPQTVQVIIKLCLPSTTSFFITDGKFTKGQKELLKVKSKQDITIQKEEPLVNHKINN